MVDDLVRHLHRVVAALEGVGLHVLHARDLGRLEAHLQRLVAVDVALGRLVEAIRAAGGEMLVTADHGNLEQMVDENGEPHTQHTVGPVPLVYVGRKARLHHGALRDLAPSVLALMGLPQPPEMSGHSLVEFL